MMKKKLSAHDRLIALRHTYVAHSDENEIERAAFTAKDTGNLVLVRLHANSSFPFDRLYELRSLIQALQEFIVDRHGDCVEGLGRRIGKPIQILEGGEERLDSETDNEGDRGEGPLSEAER